MKQKFRLSLAATGLFLCLAAGLAWYLTDKDGADAATGMTGADTLKDVDVVRPRPLLDRALITLPGRTRAATQATLFFRVSGPLAQVHVSAGDRVAKGDLLLELDDRDFIRQRDVVAQNLASARANLMKMSAGARPEDVRIIESNLLAARADLGLAEKELERHQILFKKQAVSEQAYDRAKNQVDSLAARVAALEEQYARDTAGARKEDIMAARAAVKELETRLAIAGDQLDDTKLVAPFSGVVTKRIPEAHEMVSQGAPVLTLDDYSTVEIPVAVPETHVRAFLDPDGRKARAVFLVQKGKSFEATLTKYSGRADQATGTYEFVFSVTPDEEDLIFPGMTAEIRLMPGTSGNTRPGMAIPLQSLVGVAGNSAHVFCVDEASGKVMRRPVEFESLAGTTEVRVISGIGAKDLVVAGGAPFIREGQAVAWQSPKSGEAMQ